MLPKQQQRESRNQQVQTFEQLERGIGVGWPVPEGWQSISTRPLLIMVGTTGVGKSTTTAALAAQGLTFTLLPNRRSLTDKLIISKMLKADERPIQSLNRIERFNYARCYREQFPGGMAQILTQLQVEPEQVESLLVFDGLRGQNEVCYAATALANAKFVVLDTTEWVRLQRLLNRQEVFDQITQPKLEGKNVEIAAEGLTSFAALGVPEGSKLFTLAEEQKLLTLIRRGFFSATDVYDKLTILVEERRNYDLVATRSALQALAQERTLVIDNTKLTPKEIAQKIIASLKLSNHLACIIHESKNKAKKNRNWHPDFYFV